MRGQRFGVRAARVRDPAAAFASRELAPGGLHRTPKAQEYVKLDHNSWKNLFRTGKQASRSKAAASRAHCYVPVCQVAS
jgi:hypothetical protein